MTQLPDRLQQAIALHQRGHLARAQTLYEEILTIQPRHFDALHLLGVIAGQTKNPKRAVELIDEAIGINPNHAAAHCNRAAALRELKQLNAALTSYDQAIALRADYVEAHFNRGNVLRELNQWEPALASYDRTIALKADHAEAYSNRGVVLYRLKRLEAALASCDLAIGLRADYAEAYSNRGAVLHGLRQLSAALASYDQAIALKADYAEAYCNRGNVLRELGELGAALASYNQAIALKVNLAEAYCDRGVVQYQLGRLDAALASYNQAIALKTDYAEAYCNRAFVALAGGDLENGWTDFEWRWKVKGNSSIPGKWSLSQPLWLGGESIAGKTVLLHSEQGLGDTLQFCRYVRLVADLGATVILQVQEPLRSLVRTLDGVAQVLIAGDAPPACDYHCPLMSLPLAFKTTLRTIPAQVPYLKSSVEKFCYWNKKLGAKTKLRVGLVWSGGYRPDHPQLWAVNSRRNIALAKFASLHHPAIEFYSLQKGQPAESELADLIARGWSGPSLVDFTGLLNDFSDTAALMEQLDLVISVDTSAAHLAGALGKPVWILNRFDNCWRWLADSVDSPWYPTARLYRQEKAGDWDGVVQSVRADLEQLLARHEAARDPSV